MTAWKSDYKAREHANRISHHFTRIDGPRVLQYEVLESIDARVVYPPAFRNTHLELRPGEITPTTACARA